MREEASAGHCREHGGCSSATDSQMICQTDQMQVAVSVVWMSGATLLRMRLDLFKAVRNFKRKGRAGLGSSSTNGSPAGFLLHCFRLT